MPDPLGGADWALRSWRPRSRDDEVPDRSARCAQIGQLDGGLVRRLDGGRRRRLGFDMRAVCGSIQDPEPDSAPPDPVFTVERLVERAGTPDAAPGRTILGGVAPRSARGQVVLLVRGRRHTLAADPSGAFLAVLPGSVRRADLRMRFGTGKRTRTLDLASVDPDAGGLEAGLIRRALTATDPTGGPPLALLGYRIRNGRSSERCLEPGRIIGGEVGAYSARWNSFLDGPTLADTPAFEDGWAPQAPAAFHIGSCESESGAIRDVGVKQFGRRLAVVHGFVSSRVVRLRASGPGRRRPTVHVTDSGAFLVPVVSRGRRGEKLELSARLRDGRVRRTDLALGPQNLPVPWSRWTVRGRRLGMRWFDGLESFAGYTLRESRRRVVVRILQRYPPDFAPDGAAYASPRVGVHKCLVITLRGPVGHRGVYDPDASARRRRGGRDLLRRCKREHAHRFSR